MVKAAKPIIFDYFLFFKVYGLQNSNNSIPKEIIRATITFFLPNFNLSSLTREQKTATKTTDKTLHDSNIITTG